MLSLHKSVVNNAIRKRRALSESLDSTAMHYSSRILQERIISESGKRVSEREGENPPTENPFCNTRSREIGVYPSIENLPRALLRGSREYCPNFNSRHRTTNSAACFRGFKARFTRICRGQSKKKKKKTP